MFSLIHMKDGIRCKELNERKKATWFCEKILLLYNEICFLEFLQHG